MVNFSPELHTVNPEHIGLLNDGLRSPSAHNAQPWQIKPLDDGNSYAIHYNQNPTLPEDHHDKDAFLTMGAFVETMALQAPNHNLTVVVAPELTRDGEDLYIARLAIEQATGDEPVDPLSKWIGSRVTNRNKYSKEPLPTELEDNLVELGNTLVDPKLLKDTVVQASMNAWGNQRYVHDLETWMRKDPNAEDGMTPAPFNLDKASLIALDFAYWRGSFKSKIMQYAFATGDVGAFTAASRASVLTAPDMTPSSLFDAGRRLLRSWTTINAAGYSYQPFSVAVDEASSAAKVAEIAGVDNPVALYRVGKAAKPPRGTSNRKPLSKVLI